MADVPVVTCPECKKKFRPKSDVSGKKIKCPFCKESFVVPGKAPAEDKGKPDAAKPDKAKPEDAKAAEAAAINDEFDGDVNPYGIKQVELVPRCPNCTEEMGEHDTICLACGYNTMTRQWGKTEKTKGVTFSRHLVWLLPPLGSAVFVFCSIIALLIFYTIFPMWVAEMWADFLDSEAARMWITLVFFGLFWMAGMYCFYKFIQKPKPDEIVLE